MMELQNLLKHFLAEGIPFVSFRLPSQSEPTTCFDGKFESEPPPIGRKYFVLAPFDKQSESPALYFKFQSSFIGFDIPENEIFISTHEAKVELLPFKPVEISYDQYMQQAHHLIALMQNGNLKKVVLSRIIDRDLPENLNLGILFKAYCEKYPQAFVYLFSDGTNNLWMGASPEILLKIENGLAETMSLAATQAVTNLSNRMEWGEKEKAEQKIVTDFIQERLLVDGIFNLEVSKPETVIAGNVAHLCTKFRFKVSNELDINRLVNELHPTPAVCGLPSKAALEAIRSTELNDRSYYSGYLGMIGSNGNTQLFVNLRCMQIRHDKAYLYVGGGLTADSDPEKEWEETQLKAETLGAVISNIS